MLDGILSKLPTLSLLLREVKTAIAADICRTGTYFCVDKSVTSVVIKVKPSTIPTLYASYFALT